ncbi:hypothetical protein MRX96_036177 [Rhipicephalus microplus]
MADFDYDKTCILLHSSVFCVRFATRLRAEKKDAAATTIQRWARTEFHRWLQDRALPWLSIEVSLSDNQRWADEDHGAVVSTVLKDRHVNVDTLGPP